MTNGGSNCKGHFLANARGRLMRVHPTAGQVSDCKSSDAFLQNHPAAKVLMADRGYNANLIRDYLTGKGIEPYIPPRRHRKVNVKYRKNVNEGRHGIEIFIGRLKD